MKWTHDRLNQARLRTDPAADSLIEELVQGHGKTMAMNIFEVLIRNIQLPYDKLPQEVRQFVQSHNHLPDWANPADIRLAAQVFLDHGPKFLLFLYFKSLPTLYSFANGAQVLLDTGRMAHEGDAMKVFSRRIAETGQFLLDVMSPGGLSAGGAGIQAAIKVRLIHAAIRYFVREKGWETERLGHPINQEDLASTLMTFSISMIEGMERMDLPLPPEQAEAYVHAWKVVGHLLGIEEGMMPKDVAEGKLLLDTTISRQSSPSEAGRTLTQSLILFSAGTLPGKLFDNLPRIFIRRLVGPKLSSILNVQPRYGLLFFLLPRFLKRWLGWMEKLEDFSVPVAELFERFSRKLALKMVDFFNEYKDKPFRISPELKESWGLTDTL